MFQEVFTRCIVVLYQVNITFLRHWNARQASCVQYTVLVSGPTCSNPVGIVDWEVSNSWVPGHMWGSTIFGSRRLIKIIHICHQWEPTVRDYRIGVINPIFSMSLNTCIHTFIHVSVWYWINGDSVKISHYIPLCWPYSFWSIYFSHLVDSLCRSWHVPFITSEHLSCEIGIKRRNLG